MKYKDLYIGQTASLSKRFATNDVMAFSDLSLDKNPVHIDEEYAQKSLFGNRIVHGFLSASLISAVIGTMLPGEGSVYLSQNLNFKKPVYHNEFVTAICTVMKLREDKPIVTLETICKNEKGEIVVDGTAVIKLYEE